MIMNSYSSVENALPILDNSEDIIDVDYCLVKVSERYRLMLISIASAAAIPEHEALNLTVQYAWDLSGIGENIIIFTPK
jgi:hypothetical protein